eukprot:363944-Chlamydomonas_euryale.AAC.3
MEPCNAVHAWSAAQHAQPLGSTPVGACLTRFVVRPVQQARTAAWQPARRGGGRFAERLADAVPHLRHRVDELKHVLHVDERLLHL